MASDASPGKKSFWDKAKTGGKQVFDKIGVPVHKATQKLGAETVRPPTLAKAADKAARILRSFCIDGFAADGHREGKTAKDLDHIPPEVSCFCPSPKMNTCETESCI